MPTIGKTLQSWRELYNDYDSFAVAVKTIPSLNLLICEHLSTYNEYTSSLNKLYRTAQMFDGGKFWRI